MIAIREAMEGRTISSESRLRARALCRKLQSRMPKSTEPVCAASRGRNPDKPSDRTAGIPTVQRLEINQNGTTNALTTVQKDNYIIEPAEKG